MKLMFPERTGSLTARLSRGLNGQDAMNEMLLVFGITQGGDVSATIDASYYKGPGARNGKEREFMAVEETDHQRKYIVRRLTPLECCRLQGFPDWWTDGVDGSDSAKYRLWGNGVALPCVYDVLRRIAEEVNE